MKLICWHHATGHRLQTWIPVLILVQCGLIVLYISIVQHDKDSKTEAVIVHGSDGHQNLATVRVFQFNYSQNADAGLQNVQNADGMVQNVVEATKNAGGALQSAGGAWQNADGAFQNADGAIQNANVALGNVHGAVHNPNGIMKNQALRNTVKLMQDPEIIKQKESVNNNGGKWKIDPGKLEHGARAKTNYTNDINIASSKFAGYLQVDESKRALDGAKSNHQMDSKVQKNTSTNMVDKADAAKRQSIKLIQNHGNPVNDALYSDPDSREPHDPAQSGSIIRRVSKAENGEITARAEAGDISLTRVFSRGKEMDGMSKHVAGRVGGGDRMDRGGVGSDGRGDGSNGRGNGINEHGTGIAGHDDGIYGRVNEMNGRGDGIDGHEDGINGRANWMNGRGNGANEHIDRVEKETNEQIIRIRVDKPISLIGHENVITHGQESVVASMKQIDTAKNDNGITNKEITQLNKNSAMDGNKMAQETKDKINKVESNDNLENKNTQDIPTSKDTASISKHRENNMKIDNLKFDAKEHEINIQTTPGATNDQRTNDQRIRDKSDRVVIMAQSNRPRDEIQDVSAEHLNKSLSQTFSRYSTRSAGPYADSSLRNSSNLSSLLANHPESVMAKSIINVTYVQPTFQKDVILQPNLFRTYNLSSPPIFKLRDDINMYFTKHPRNLTCLGEGTASVFIRDAQAACICRPSWNGPHCSVPDAAMYTSALRYMNSLKPLIDGGTVLDQGTTKGSQNSNTKPRRIINAITFNVEWELLEARLFELGDLVDVYIIAESNYTQYGDPKPLRLLDRLRKGYLQEFHHKIYYLFTGSFPEGGKDNGWVVDQFARTYIGTQGLDKIKGVRPDDIFMYTDADEIPSREVLLFLKLHHGYPEPFGLALRWSVFGFFWKQYDLTRIMVGCSVEMLQKVFQNDVYKLRTVNYQGSESGFQSSWGGILMEWYLGDGGAHAGWHCSWCMPPDRIQIKLISALNADFPRWGDYPDKRDLTYIRNLIKTGTWFDDKTTFNSLVNKDSDPVLAPAYMLEHFTKYEHLLDLNCVK